MADYPDIDKKHHSTFEGFHIPKANYSPIPHQLIKELPRFETLAELKIVLYVLRHTWGYQDDYKKITLDEFANGRKQKDGTRMDDGVGMSHPSIVSGIKKAIEHGFLYSYTDGNDKARVKKYYSLTEQGLKDLTPDVKELNASSKETLPRTENNTIEKNNREIADAPQSDKKPVKKERARDLLYEAVALHCFNLDYYNVAHKADIKANNGRIGKLLAYLNEKDSNPSLLAEFKIWYSKKFPTMSFPKDLAKFSSHYNEFIGAKQLASVAPPMPERNWAVTQVPDMLSEAEHQAQDAARGGEQS